jgi:N6-L-threonylcarbamoyladenine synthase
MRVLGIETSCDETAAAVVDDGRRVLSSVVYSQVAAHRPYGGVVPEIASRKHVEHLPGVIAEAMSRARADWGQLDAVAVTYGPGLATSLLVGLAAAKALALRLQKPLVGVNHIEAHLYSVFLGESAVSPAEIGPFTALVVSGGHTSLFRTARIGDYTLLGQTIDDAAGEAFDKGAKLLGLGYPGGPAIDRVSAGADPRAVAFPRGRPRSIPPRLGALAPRHCVSFSGLKTALLYRLRDSAGPAGDAPTLAAGYQEAIVDTLVRQTTDAVGPGECLAVSGGVSLNRRLREKLQAAAQRQGYRLLLAAPAFCADNAAMVAGLAGYELAAGLAQPAGMDLDACPGLALGRGLPAGPALVS